MKASLLVTAGRRWRWCLAIALLATCNDCSRLWAEPPKVQILQTEGGVRFGVLGPKPDKPAPTLIVLASSPEETLGSEYFLQCGVMLAKQGYLCVSLDLPCHGQDGATGEPAGIAGWRHRLGAGKDLMGDFNRRGKAMIDHLVANGFTDDKKIAACGTSRGGFAALHLAAHDPRVRCVAAIAPATDLLLITEFKGMTHPERAMALSVINLADALCDRGVWVVIGDRDHRVSTDSAIAFARKLSTTAEAKNVPGKVDLLVRAEPRGHTTPPGSAELAAAWVAEQLQTTTPN